MDRRWPNGTLSIKNIYRILIVHRSGRRKRCFVSSSVRLDWKGVPILIAKPHSSSLLKSNGILIPYFSQYGIFILFLGVRWGAS
ncbi:hypothetical protein BQ8794_330063 [Mesorhizobium prunaredense]|uniref:Uncharacterized protein n=1 Tax=Mesorhizobium prunaredense TaxID=1631249 RepID=A0A1R3VEU6_9HYPH|nr:hypothetical protein BQ8794_330063 [Mesorhizobium prunaredense]